MLADAALAVATVGDEGLVTEALLASDVFVRPSPTGSICCSMRVGLSQASVPDEALPGDRFVSR